MSIAQRHVITSLENAVNLFTLLRKNLTSSTFFPEQKQAVLVVWDGVRGKYGL